MFYYVLFVFLYDGGYYVYVVLVFVLVDIEDFIVWIIISMYFCKFIN